MPDQSRRVGTIQQKNLHISNKTLQLRVSKGVLGVSKQKSMFLGSNRPTPIFTCDHKLRIK